MPADQSTIPAASLVMAGLVIAVAAAAVARISWQARREARMPPTPGTGSAAATTSRGDGSSPRQGWGSSTSEPGSGPIAFLVSLGRAMIDSGASVTQVGESLGRIAHVNGIGSPAIVVFPTALFVSMPGEDDIQTSITPAGSSLRLDQIDAVFQVVDAAESGEIRPEVGLARLARAREMPPAFAWHLRLVGYPLIAAGLVAILRGSWMELLVSTLLATAVGTLRLRTKVPPAYAVFLPVVAAFGVSLTVFLLAESGVDIDVYTPVMASLITFLPGAQLTTAVIELATGQMMAGAGRLAQGVMYLVMLAIGIAAAGEIAGVSSSALVYDQEPVGWLWAPWVGVILFGVGVVLSNSARASSLPWIILILAVAYGGQTFGGLYVGSQLSGFIGALLMTPVAMLAASRPSGPPTLVTFLPAFWLLVPGALGLSGITKYLDANSIEGATSLLTTGTTMVGIAFGVLLGLASGSLIGLRSGVSLSGHRP